MSAPPEGTGPGPCRTPFRNTQPDSCLVDHRDEGCGASFSDASDFCAAHPDAYAERPSPVLHNSQSPSEEPDCVTSHLWHRRQRRWDLGLLKHL